MLYYKAPIKTDEYEIAMSHFPDEGAIQRINNKLHDWNENIPLKIEDIIKEINTPSVEKLILLRQIKMIFLMRDFILEVHSSTKSRATKYFGSSLLYDIIIMDNKKIAEVLSAIENYKIQSFKMGLQKWELSREGGSRILRDEIVAHYTDYLDIYIDGTKYK